MAGAVWATENSFQEEIIYWNFLCFLLNINSDFFSSVQETPQEKDEMTKTELSTAQDNSSS